MIRHIRPGSMAWRGMLVSLDVVSIGVLGLVIPPVSSFMSGWQFRR